MSRFNDEDLLRWKREINPAPILSKRIQIERRLADWWAVCPFHPDKNPSFEMSKDADGAWFYHCYGCGASGNIFQFVQQFDSLEHKDKPIAFREAVMRVLTEAGVAGWSDGEEQGDPEIEAAEAKVFQSWPLSYYAAAEIALEKSPEAQAWLTKRGIGMAVARRFHLGFLPTTARVNSHNPWADKGWIAFPTLSEDGKTVTAVKYRSLIGKKDGKVSGIEREPGTTTSLYNLQVVKPGEDVWIVEGEPDTLVLAQAGVIVVGYPTASYVPTDEECERLSTAKRRFLAGDSDAPGEKAMAALKERLHGETFRIKWPNNRKDANDVLTNECGNDQERFKLLLANLQQRATQKSGELEFHLPAVVTDRVDDFVVQPAPGEMDGWFPLDAPSLIGGASGSAKTTWMMQLLLAQINREAVLGHATCGRPFLVLMADRGRASHERTMRRLGMENENIPIKFFTPEAGTTVLQEIVNRIEETSPLPQIIFIEGEDLLVEDGNDKHEVMRFMSTLQKIATRYHLAIIGSVGSPKSKAGEGYIAKRDNISGTEAWGRLAETVAVLQYPQGKDTAAERELTVMPRNAPTESFAMTFKGGRLVLQTAADKRQAEGSTHELDWVRLQAHLAETDPAKKWWTRLDLSQALRMPKSTTQDWINHALTKGWVIQKPGKKVRGRGRAAEYCWNQSKTNLLWIDDRENDGNEDFSGSGILIQGQIERVN